MSRAQAQADGPDAAGPYRKDDRGTPPSGTFAVTDLACPDCGSECLQRPDGSWECVICGTVL